MELQSALNLTLPMSEELFYCFLVFCLFLWKKIGGVAVCLELDIGNVRGFFLFFFVCFFLGKIGGVAAWLELDIANVGGVFYCFYLFFCLFLWKK